MKHFLFLTLLITLLLSCQTEEQKLFERLTESSTGITFANNLAFDKDFNIFTYRNFYNGGGVGVGDFNNDGLYDLYFNSNQAENKLYLNQGEFRFEDITSEAGVAGEKAWSTGVSIADVNADGFVDIYVCNSGDIKGDDKQNELFINNGDLTFTESATEYGLADPGFSTHAAFFDYDNDGDLDLYLLNNSYQAIGSFDLRRNERPNRDPIGGDKLFRNDNGKFLDVSEEAGIYGSIIGFGLGITIGDVDRDGWQDIYVSNDFFERDYLYINNQDGTFEEVLEAQIKSLSAASMGADMADINNDGLADIFVTDMLPEPDHRVKTVTTFENWDKYSYNLVNGYYHQFTRNMLQLNNGDNTFSEIGRLAGVEATDWSWGALIFDFENDGKKDIFIANGIYQDLTNQDFLQYAKEEEVVKKIISKTGVDYQSLINLIPTQAVPNYAYSNQDNLQFENRADTYGLDEPSFSNGSAYVDLDNDGDLDLVINNVNMPAFVYKNNAELLFPENNYLKLVLNSSTDNRSAFGAKATLHCKDELFYQEQMPIRAFESTMDSRLNYGVGTNQVVDSIIIKWPNGAIQKLVDVSVNQTLVLEEPQSTVTTVGAVKENRPVFFEELETASEFEHKENLFVDFDRDRLIFHMISREGPCLCKGDINGDGLEDAFIGGASGQSGGFYLQGQGDISFKELGQNADAEDVDCELFDADGDGDLDLYVASGGYEFNAFSSSLADRLYLNHAGNFIKTQQVLPAGKFENSSSVTSADIDADGDLDLFVGIRTLPGQYGLPASSHILLNDGNGIFSEISPDRVKGLKGLGMVTDGDFLDYDQDGDQDLIVSGEWMDISLFINQDGSFEIEDSTAGFANSAGWWNRLVVDDLNGDGYPDLIAGNHGLNSRFSASKSEPVALYVNDFDRNGSIEQVITQYNGPASYPMALRHDLIKQMPNLKKKYLKYESYKEQRVNDVFNADQIEQAVKLEAYELETVVFLNIGDGSFKKIKLPVEAQFSTTKAIEVYDLNGDGYKDILIGGNFYATKPEVGRYDAQYGLVLLGDGTSFSSLRAKESGLYLTGETRDMTILKGSGQPLLLAAKNNGEPQLFTIK